MQGRETFLRWPVSSTAVVDTCMERCSFPHQLLTQMQSIFVGQFMDAKKAVCFKWCRPLLRLSFMLCQGFLTCGQLHSEYTAAIFKWPCLQGKTEVCGKTHVVRLVQCYMDKYCT